MGRINLPKIAPESRRFIEQLALHVADWTAIKIDYAVSDWGPKCHIAGAGPERAGEAMSSTEEPEELLRAWFPMTDAELEQITHGGDAFSQGEVFKRGELPPIGKWETVAFFGRRSPREDPRFLYMTTVARCWRHLSSQHRAAQSPKAAIAYLTRPRRPEIGEI